MTSFSKTIDEKKLPRRAANEKINDPALYRPPAGLWDAAAVALEMGLPLLLTGEPGTGKTQFAHYLASYFGLGKALVFDAQTTSTARDLFYNYDALGHFQYAQTQNKLLSPDEVEKNFIRYQALGLAIKEDKPFVVLLDEIDKAPRDLPNNVLAALEELKFSVPEAGREFRASSENRPVIVMTSNSEKNLPDPFLRRVAYFHIPFPDEAMLLEILQLKTEGFGKDGLGHLIRHFGIMRDERKVKLRKPPATAELIHWALLLGKMNFDAARLENPAGLTAKEKQQLEISYTVLAKNKEDLAALKEMMRRS
jgi:MoxR-like ATPase